jgi:hypothetical protein
MNKKANRSFVLFLYLFLLSFKNKHVFGRFFERENKKKEKYVVKWNQEKSRCFTKEK